MEPTRKYHLMPKVGWIDVRISPETWAGLNLVFRYGIAVVVLGISAIVMWFQADAWWFWAPLAVAGVILLMFTGGRDDFLGNQKKPWR